MRRKLLFYALLAAATLGLSEFLSAWRAWRAAPTIDAAAAVVALAAGLVVVMLWLGFVLYEVDRAAGRVRRRVGLYEWVLARRDAAGRHATTWPAAHPSAGPGRGR
ncbi:MAG TPA: hypothetical protein VKZ50_21705 [bacterium]|nr:hypothetical protein [bacterium]